MSANKFGLGKGLGALLPQDEQKAGVTELPITEIAYSPFQPRTQLNEESLSELAQSIKRSGLIQPVIVRRTQNGYELIAGERRLRAAKIAGYDKIPVVIKEISDHDAAEFGLVENIQREDLNAIDIARAMQRLHDDFGYTQDSIAEGIKKSRPYVANLLRLLDLPDIVQDAILSNRISEGHGRAMLSLKDTDHIIVMMDRVIKNGFSVRETERAVKTALTDTPKKPVKIDKSPEMAQAEAILRESLGTKVHVQKGRIEIEYYSNEDLVRICEAVAK